ncbi:hypothetical protein WKI68_44030 [Streptomyces sp. MS1.HAVA.3]|uniref:Glucodextranase-like C-terminal domain-containing protein n=1 Tax=Streptomyces caledonius TaxID=3134107 RepID=A0ABU8UFS1_9ACTN
MTTTYRGHAPYGNDQWAYVAFDVPAGVQRISVSTSHDASAGILDLGIFGPSGFRGWSGGERSGFTLSAAEATPGYVPGLVEPGKWSVILGPMVGSADGMAWQVDVTLHHGDPLPRTRTTSCRPRWRGGGSAGTGATCTCTACTPTGSARWTRSSRPPARRGCTSSPPPTTTPAPPA